ncbi:ATP synthase subunit C lysine N-methyltransferase [Pseudolycoriella hygida]|uniref:ATP synthase subunit C lysine N-methyltransferase n=1 Tax=Pseudolycoriella hygida TaxID=35572 RepID=A0A9Q0MXD1_9DIPT|nr:ATP synthase subunit C lysine N-methyltransferase [Pseudolycoriella hygida]
MMQEFLEENKNDVNKSPQKKTISTSGKILIGLTGGLGIAFSVICGPFVAPAFRKYCLPYVPATTTQLENILSVLKHSKTGRLLDIGSGDGRIVVAAAKNGFHSDGVELNPWLVQYSRIAALTQGVSGKTKFYRKDLWKFDVSPYKHIVIFGVEQMMAELESKLQMEMKNDSQIIVCRFPLPNLTASQIIGGGVDTVWVYNIKKTL